MKKILYLSCILFINQFIFGQIDVELIKKNVIENPKENYYPLLEIFKVNPSQLNQNQLNQLYYGSKFLKSNYTMGDYYVDYEKIWKHAKKRISKDKVPEILHEAEPKYLKNPFNMGTLEDMINIYNAADDMQKANLCFEQKQAILNTIEKSGDGLTENTPICVIIPGDVMRTLEKLNNRTGEKLEQSMKQLADGSILTIYKIGNQQVVVKLVGGYY